jgi:hypothetical protein
VAARVANGAHIFFAAAFGKLSRPLPALFRTPSVRSSRINRGAHPRATANSGNIRGTSMHYTFEEFH